MRILQVIDSLQPGGAEKMAINYANAWVNHSEQSFLIATNKGGALKAQISDQVTYKIYNRQLWNLVFVIFKILLFIKKNRIDTVQAHASSYKWAKFIKLCYPKIIFIWHDHNGNRVSWPNNKNQHIIEYSKYFDFVFACNPELENWAKNNLKVKNVFYIPNFAISEINEKVTFLKGDPNKRIVCIANWRHPKNHLFLIQAFHQSNIAKQGWSLHLVGKAYQDKYEQNVLNYIESQKVNNIFRYGMCTDTNFILSQVQIGILVSTYEGFPVTLLEYGLAGLCPIVSNVGFMSKLVNNLENGYTLNKNDLNKLIEIFRNLAVTNDWNEYGEIFKKKIESDYSAEIVIKKFIQFIHAY